MGLTDTEILDRLKVQYEIQIAKKTLRRRPKDWNLKRQLQTLNTLEPRAQISDRFLNKGGTNSEILHSLEKDGFDVTHKGLS